jgi:hypothetical protein
VIAAPVAAATTEWNPFDSPERRLPAPTNSSAPVAPALADRLAVLRRPQTHADRTAAERGALDALDRDVEGVQLASVRSLPHGAVLIPVERVAPKAPEGTTDPPAGRNDAVCLYSPTRDGASGGGLGCFTAADIAAGRAIGNQAYVIDGLVPDGVENVRLSAGTARTTAPVRDNYFAVEFKEARWGALPIARARGAIWLDAAGHTIRRIDYKLGEPPAPSGDCERQVMPDGSALVSPGCVKP